VADPWNDFDSVTHRLQLDPSAKEKWDSRQLREQEDSQRQIQLHAGRPSGAWKALHPNPNRPLDELQSIGETLLEEFDPTQLELDHCLDAAALHTWTGWAEEKQKWEEQARACSGRLTHLMDVSMESLRAEETECESQASQSSPPPLIAVPCLAPLCWFADALEALPYVDAAKKMHLQRMALIATHTSSSAHMLMWKQIVETVAILKQDLCDYLTHAGIQIQNEPMQKSEKKRKMS
jgi:hypothetical protein